VKRPVKDSESAIERFLHSAQHEADAADALGRENPRIMKIFGTCSSPPVCRPPCVYRKVKMRERPLSSGYCSIGDQRKSEMRARRGRRVAALRVDQDGSSTDLLHHNPRL